MSPTQKLAVKAPPPEPPMLDLAPIRARLATPILCERCGDFPAAFEGPDEVVQLLCTHCADGQELDALPEHQTPEREVIAALLFEVERLQTGGCARDQRTTQFCAEVVARDAEIARLTSELAAATRPYLILDDPEGIIGCVDAASPEAAWEAFKAANPDDYDGAPADNDVVIRRVTAEMYDSAVDDLEVARSELAAAQAELTAARRGPVVEWYPTTVGEAARLGMSWLSVGPGGWTLRIRLPFGLGIGDLVESGPETGDAGKAACEAAYRRAVGL